MKYRIIFTFVLAAVAMQQAIADDYNYLTVAYNQVEKSITLGTVRKITFSDTNVIVTTTEGDYSFALSEMEKMTFTADPTAIQRLPEQTGNLRYENGKLTSLKAGTLRIYNASGALIHLGSVTDKGGIIDLNSLPAGLYIISQGDQAIKIKK